MLQKQQQSGLQSFDIKTTRLVSGNDGPGTTVIMMLK